MSQTHDYNPSDTRRWETNRGPLPVYGVSTYQRPFNTWDEHGKNKKGNVVGMGEFRGQGGVSGGGKPRCQGERTKLRRMHKKSTNNYLPFRVWLAELNAGAGPEKDVKKASKKKNAQEVQPEV